MPVQGILFDFNGTLFFDSHLHVQAFDLFLQKHFGRSLYPGENEEHIHARANRAIMEYFFGKPLSDAECDALGDEKEAIYRSLCTPEMRLVKGAERLFDDLTARGIPMAIASASPKSNADFYFPFFGLDRWFTHDQFIYLDASHRGKPAPDLYLRAAAAIGVNPARCVVFEDSDVGIQAARSANAAYVAAIAPDPAWRPKRARPDAVLTDFDAFDRALLDAL